MVIPESAHGSRGFLAALRTLPQNPLLQREWRAFVHDLRAGPLFRRPRTVRAWVIPAVASGAVLPYGVWLLVTLAYQAAPVAASLLRELDTLGAFQVWSGVLQSLLALLLVAPTIAGERERRTWEGLRTAGLSSHELLLGSLVGRLGPLLAGSLVCGLLWMALRSHYAPLLQPYSPYTMHWIEVGVLATDIAAVILGSGFLALAASTWSDNTRAALIAALVAWLALLLAISGVLGLFSGVAGGQLILRCCLLASLCGYLVALAGVVRTPQ
ncbi:MAG: hypothetical protein K0Q72_1626 [Armatimonadetes bacterium]|jgi:hypothetical protein|nr:hypothetical protein [Armatimonadota bacterium]